ncbi:MAG: hypothetical protein ACE5KA_09305 [Nitrososphaerales archaeon]
MTKEIPDEDKLKILNFYVCYLMTMRQIADATGYSTGAISGVVKEAKKKVPDLDELRQLNVMLKESNSSVIEVMRYGEMLKMIDTLDVALDDIPQCIEIFERYGTASKSFLEGVEEMRKLEGDTGMTYKQIIYEYNLKTQLFKEIKERVEQIRSEEQRRKDSISSLTQIKQIQDRLNKNGVSPAKLDSYMEFHKELESLSFTLQVAFDLAKALSKLGMTPKEAVSQLAEIISNYPNLKAAIRMQEQRKERLDAALNLLAGQSGTLRLEKSVLEDAIKNLEETEGRLKQRISALIGEKQAEEDEIREVMKKISELEQKLDHIDSLFNTKIQVAVLASLMNDPEKLHKSKMVFEVMLGLLNGLETCIKVNSLGIRHPLEIARFIKDGRRVLSHEIQNTG